MVVALEAGDDEEGLQSTVLRIMIRMTATATTPTVESNDCFKILLSTVCPIIVT